MENLFEIDKVGYYISKMHTSLKVTRKRKTTGYEFELYTKVTDSGASVINEKKYPHKKGNVLMAKPGSIRNSISQFECHCVHFRCNNKELEEKYLKNLPTIIAPSNINDFIDIFKSITDAMISKFAGYRLYVDAKITELISLLYSLSVRYNGTNSKYSHYNFNVSEAISYMKANCSNHITLEDMAKTANLSPSYFHLVFKEIIGESPYKYLLGIRINCAKNLLLNSKLPLTRIAEEAGFGSQAYFNYVFKKELGITPKMYRNTKSIII